MDLANPLTDEELDELSEFLLSAAAGDDAMDISMLDGFLTALAIGPRNLPPSRWLPLIWGRGVAWQTREQAERMRGLALRHANSLLFSLRNAPDSFEPLLFEREYEGRMIPIIDEWCVGFVRGMTLDEAGWRSLMEAEEGEELLYPILLHGTEAGGEALRNNPVLEDRYEEFAAALGESVMAILEWWRPVHTAKASRRQDEARGAGDVPCPCGSGKPFKQCCGRGGKVLH